MYIIGLDLGQSKDYTALAVIDKVDNDYQVRKLERTRGTPYPDVVTRVEEILEKVPDAALVVDATGVGAPVVNMFTRSGLEPIGIYIHGGDRATHEGSTWRVPKRDLVGVLQVLLQNQRLKIAPGPLSGTLADEMLNFKVKIDPTTAHDSYSAWREADHDDLVLAAALACWWGEYQNQKKKLHFTAVDVVIGGYIPPVSWDYVSPEAERAREIKKDIYNRTGRPHPH